MLQVLTNVHDVNCAQARQLLEVMDGGMERDQAACCLLQSVVDPQNVELIESVMPAASLKRVYLELGLSQLFNTDNATGRYVLHLDYQVGSGVFVLAETQVMSP